MEFTKLSYRVCFSEQLRLPNLSEGVTPRLYDLFAIGRSLGTPGATWTDVMNYEQSFTWVRERRMATMSP